MPRKVWRGESEGERVMKGPGEKEGGQGQKGAGGGGEGAKDIRDNGRENNKQGRSGKEAASEFHCVLETHAWCH